MHIRWPDLGGPRTVATTLAYARDLRAQGIIQIGRPGDTAAAPSGGGDGLGGADAGPGGEGSARGSVFQTTNLAVDFQRRLVMLCWRVVVVIGVV